eukprot:TRINITY_DN2593_c0_g1_i3.p1 TRINITY_DN2593_c0_g1~~TRINITY_DN2593_c0_g1_i3.p1  ORF type:complete len:192 (+),score=3.97 TRINITY_DN2593_c0_g1_i3:51-626(+)
MSFKPLVDLKPSTWDNSKESTVTEDKLTNVTVLSFRKRRLSSLPDCLGLLTGLVDLGIPFNHFEHLPKCIALLTNLTTLSVRGNKGMTRLPLFVTELRKLQELRIHDDEKFSIRQIPLGISELPCWSNDTKRWSDMRFTYREELTRLSTYNLSKHTCILPKLYLGSNAQGDCAFRSASCPTRLASWIVFKR